MQGGRRTQRDAGNEGEKREDDDKAEGDLRRDRQGRGVDGDATGERGERNGR